MTRAISELRFLLDVNVLLALAWPNHQFHAAARERLEPAELRWASCALTQLGFLRLFLTPAVVGTRKSTTEALAILAAMIGDNRHEFWPHLPPARATDMRWVQGPGQVTDAYLLALARQNGGKVMSFDARMEHLGGSTAEVEILGR